MKELAIPWAGLPNDRFRPILLKNSQSQARQNSAGYRGIQKFNHFAS
jgi:hypothetical protein